MIIRADRRLVPKIDRGADLLRLGSYPGVYLGLPLCRHLGILLIYPLQWVLRRQAELPEQTHDTPPAQFDPKFSPNQFRHQDRCPQGECKFHLAGVLVHHRRIDPLQLLTIQLRSAATSLAGIERSPAAVAVLGKPTKQCSTRHPHPLADFPHTYSTLNLLYGLLSKNGQFRML